MPSTGPEERLRGLGGGEQKGGASRRTVGADVRVGRGGERQGDSSNENRRAHRCRSGSASVWFIPNQNFNFLFFQSVVLRQLLSNVSPECIT